MIKHIFFVTIFVTLTSFSILRLILIPLEDRNKMKYILQWTNPKDEPFSFMGKGQATFLKRKCPVNNCYVTSIKSVLNRIKDFDAILFHGPNLRRNFIDFPKERSAHQKYVFVSMESPVYYPLRSRRYNDFFNWTWTYKLNSDQYLGYIIIKNKKGDIIGPKENMNWLKVKDMKTVDPEFKNKLKSKKIAAAWFVSNCKALNKRQEIASQLQSELARYNMTLDIYGLCSNKQCPRENETQCLRIIERDYYFYLSFENTLSEDYVTEKLLTALQHNAVPIVYGGANYTRFMPDGSYLDVRTLGVRLLVKKMVDSINNKEIYYDFFRWHNHYSYHKIEETPETDPYCRFCRKLNDVNLVKQISIYEDFRVWWNSKTCTDNKFNDLKDESTKAIDLIDVKCY